MPELTHSLSAQRQAWRYLQASIIGTLANFLSRFPLTEVIGFGPSVLVANYIGMALVYLLSYKRAFAAKQADTGTIGRFVLVAHVGLGVTWAVSMLTLYAVASLLPELLAETSTRELLAAWGLGELFIGFDSGWIPQMVEGFCHGCGIVAGFFMNFFGHRLYSFGRARHAQAGK